MKQLNETTSIITKTKNGMIITVEITKDVINDVAYADGHNINLDKKTYNNTTITLVDGDKKIYCRDINFFSVLEGKNKEFVTKQLPTAYARLSDNYISKATYDLIKGMIAEAENNLSISAEYNEVKKAEHQVKLNAEKDEAESIKFMVERAKQTGWCSKCESYCYGDCQS